MSFKIEKREQLHHEPCDDVVTETENSLIGLICTSATSRKLLLRIADFYCPEKYELCTERNDDLVHFKIFPQIKI